MSKYIRHLHINHSPLSQALTHSLSHSRTHSLPHSIRVTPTYNFQERHLRCFSVFKSTTFCCVCVCIYIYIYIYIYIWYLRDDDDYMFRLSFLSQLHFVTLGYFNTQLTLILSTICHLHKLDIYKYLYIFYTIKSCVRLSNYMHF